MQELQNSAQLCSYHIRLSIDTAMLSSIKVVDKHEADEAFRKEQKALKKQKKKRRKVPEFRLLFHRVHPGLLQRC